MKTVRVNIECRETVIYHQIVDMDIEDLERYNKAIVSGNIDESMIADIAENYIDRTDVCDGLGLEDIEFTED